MIKAIFFDIDGTILSHRIKDVPISTRQALCQLSDIHVDRVIATGRRFYVDGDSGTENCFRLQKSFLNFLHSSHALYGVWLLIFWKGADANEG